MCRLWFLLCRELASGLDVLAQKLTREPRSFTFATGIWFPGFYLQLSAIMHGVHQSFWSYIVSSLFDFWFSISP